MRLTLLILILFITYRASSDNSCVLFANTFISWTVHEDSVAFTFGKNSHIKWIALGFNSVTNNSMDGANIFKYYKNELHEYLGTGYEKPVHIRQVEFNYTNGDSFWEEHITFKMPLNGTLFRFQREEEQRLILAYNTEKIPNSSIGFEIHTNTYYKDLNFYTWGKSVSLKNLYTI